MARALSFAWFFAIALLTLSQGYSLARQGADWFRRIDARLSVRRIAENSFRYFEGRRPPAGEAFWKAIGRNAPLNDPWGHPYVIEHRADGGFLCRSAGEDGFRDTGDDITFDVPYGFTLDMLHPEKGPAEVPIWQRVHSAK